MDKKIKHSSVAGFEFSQAACARIRNCDVSLRIIFALQKHGMIILSEQDFIQSVFHPSKTGSAEYVNEYWEFFNLTNNKILLIVHEKLEECMIDVV
jgi:hypothetical protein